LGEHLASNAKIFHLRIADLFLVNTFAAGLNQVVHAKTGGSHVALHGLNSGVISARELFKCSKDSANLVV